MANSLDADGRLVETAQVLKVVLVDLLISGKYTQSASKTADLVSSKIASTA